MIPAQTPQTATSGLQPEKCVTLILSDEMHYFRHHNYDPFLTKQSILGSGSESNSRVRLFVCLHIVLRRLF